MSCFYRVAAKPAERDGVEVLVPDVAAAYRVIRPYREWDGCFIVEVESALADGEYAEQVTETHPAVSTHLGWWAANPGQDPGWEQPA